MINDSLCFVGFGKMAEGIYLGLKQKELIPLDSITFVEPYEPRKNEISTRYGLRPSLLIEGIQRSSYILFCIKPQQVAAVLEELKEISFNKKCVLSILAGTKISQFEDALGTTTPVIRTMPNLPATMGEGMTALAFNASVKPEHRDFALKLFQAVGEVECVEEEWMDCVTGISGSGPAFLYRLAHQIASVAPDYGMPYNKALRCIAQTLVGAGKMLLHSDKSPQQLIEEVSSPSGTTVAGLNAFDNSAIDSDIQNVIKAAIDRSVELGR